MVPQPPHKDQSTLTKLSNSSSETQKFAEDLAIILQPGDLVALSGDLGAGKSVIARAIIRYIARDDELEVPSPTFTICQSYDTILPIAHYDLYRFSGPEELDEFAWQEELDEGCLIIEWPQNGFEQLPVGAIEIEIAIIDETSRKLHISGKSEFIERLDRSLEIRAFLEAAELQQVTRKSLSADASPRKYETFPQLDNSPLLMNSPATPDGPPVRDGKPYSQIAHIAENIDAFVAIGELLIDKGFRAPAQYQKNLKDGLLLLEDMGHGAIVDQNRAPIPERYLTAIEFLAEFHQQQFPSNISYDHGSSYTIPIYDREALKIEIELLLDWYAPHFGTNAISPNQISKFHQITDALFAELETSPTTLVLRDFHSPNIIWRDQETGTKRIGLIDFQDAVIGPQAYDVASLAQDARIDVSENLENALVNRYIKLRTAKDTAFDEAKFRTDYAIMAAQRNSKILGIFVRLNKRDDKPEYMAHLPRIREYLARNLKHPILSNYKIWLTQTIGFKVD